MENMAKEDYKVVLTITNEAKKRVIKDVLTNVTRKFAFEHIACIRQIWINEGARGTLSIKGMTSGFYEKFHL